MQHRLLFLVTAVAAVMPAFGAVISVNLGAAGSFGLLGGTITNTGASHVVGDVGATTTITPNPGTGPWTVTGTVYAAGDPAAMAAYGAFGSAFNAAMLLPTISPYDLNSCPTGGTLKGDCLFVGNNAYLLPGTDISTTTGTVLTFDAQNTPNYDFVIRINGALTVNGILTFNLINGAQANHIFWIVGTNATISVGSSPAQTFDGSILAGSPGSTFTMSAAEGGSAVLAGTINGCVFANAANTLAGRTDVAGCVGYDSPSPGAVPEPGSAGLVGLGCLLGLAAWRKLRVRF
jgi:hypothetical protein